MTLVILGGGESGTGAAILAKQKEIDVFVSDAGIIANKYKQVLNDLEISFQENGHNLKGVEKISEVIKSPGIPKSAPIIVKLSADNIPIIDEIEFASRFIEKKSKILAITGSNGKSTTAYLTYHLLKSAGFSVVLAGNIGYSLAKVVAQNQYDYYVLELSSFQIECLKQFKADIVCLTNITPDHLDRYENSMTLYAETKFSILRNMTPSDHFIFNMDDPVSQANVHGTQITPAVYGITKSPANTAGIFISKNTLNITIDGESYTFPKNSLKVPGVHNEYNAMTAITAALICGVPATVISDALPTFNGLPHRIEWCGAPNGIHFYNDSKATNVASTAVAFNCFNKSIVWIAGGIDKGNNYNDLLPIVEEKVIGIVCLGKDNSKIIKTFAHLGICIHEVDNITSALNAALNIANDNSVVLLSPACASFDLFCNAEDRGNQFREKVKEFVLKYQN